jgi:hypothetical protein
MIIPPIDRVLEALKREGLDPRPARDGHEARCPVHRGDRRDVSVRKAADGRVLIFCHRGVGCDHGRILEALGLSEADLLAGRDNSPPSSNGRASKSRSQLSRDFPSKQAVVNALAARFGASTVHDYPPTAEGVAWAVVRLDRRDHSTGKTTKTYRPVYESPLGWRIGNPQGRQPLYRADTLADAEVVWVAQRETCADRLAGLGLASTTSAFGARSVDKFDWSPLTRRRVVILPDADRPGEDYAGAVVGRLAGLRPPPTVTILRLRDFWTTDQPIEKGYDLDDWLRVGVPDAWSPDQCRTELERAAAAAREVDLRAVGSPASRIEVEEGDWPVLRMGEPPPVQEFPLDVLPDSAARLAEEAAAAIGCSRDILAAPILAIAGGLIGGSASLRVDSNHFASAIIYAAAIGLPGDGKSPALGYVRAPVDLIDAEYADAYARAKHVQAEFVAARPRNEPKPPPPPRDRIVLDDGTIEAVLRRLAKAPRGLIWLLDELGCLTQGLNQYKGGRGNDLPTLLKLWTGGAVTIDRVKDENDEPVYIPHPRLSIYGNLTPIGLPAMTGGGDVGFVDRWLFVYPDRHRRPLSAARRPVTDDAVRDWEDTARRLWSRQPRTEGERRHPHVVHYSSAGKSESNRLHDAHIEEVNGRDFADELRGPWAKMEVYAQRFALILALLRHAAIPGANPYALPDVKAEIVRAAWKLVDYFKWHHRRVRAVLQGRGLAMPEGAKLVLRRISNHADAEVFSLRDLTRNHPPSRGGPDPGALMDGLLWLQGRGAVRPASGPERPAGTAGRKPSMLWQVHPELRARAQRNQQNPRNDGDSPDGVEPADSADSAARAGESTEDRVINRSNRAWTLAALGEAEARPDEGGLAEHVDIRTKHRDQPIRG